MGRPLLEPSTSRARSSSPSEADTLRALYPDNPRLQQFPDEDRLVVSEPLGDLPGAWLAVPESMALIIQPGADEQRPFEPRWP